MNRKAALEKLRKLYDAWVREEAEAIDVLEALGEYLKEPSV